MKLFINETIYIETVEGIDISIPMGGKNADAKAWYVGSPVIEPVRGNGFVGSVAEGGSVNFRNIFFNPHGNGTHTECLGHITKEVYSINEHLKDFIVEALLISISPEKIENGDLVITKRQLQGIVKNKKVKALVIRTIPNLSSKLNIDYSSTNPPYMDVGCVDVLNEMGVEHLLLDLPSVDRESDNGVLAVHHKFWGVPDNPQFHKTITELIYVPDSVSDGNYLLSLQVAPFENDASPSRPVLYQLKTKKS
jgi:arylformamidase